MEVYTPSVPEAVRMIIGRNPHLYECLKMRVLNYNAVAEVIQSEVEEMVGKRVNTNTIVAALVRYANSIAQQEAPSNPLEALKKAKFTLTTGVADITIQTPHTRQSEILKELFDFLSSEQVTHFNIFKTPDSLRVIMSTEDFERIRVKLEDIGLNYEDGYARLNISLSTDEEELPDILNFITENLYRSGIRSMDAFFNYDDIVLILKESDAPKAFDILRKQVEYIRRKFMEE